MLVKLSRIAAMLVAGIPRRIILTDEQNEGQTGQNARVFVLKQRVPVETSQGTFFARHMTIRDIKLFSEYFDEKSDKGSIDLRALGERLLKLLVCANNETDKEPVLTEDVYKKLSPADIKLLTEGVSEACNVVLLSDGDSLTALGSAVFDQLVEQGKRMAETAAKIKETMNSSFGSMPASLKATLGENLTGLATISEALKMSPAVEAMQKAQEERDRLFGSVVKELVGNSAASEALRNFREDKDCVVNSMKKGFPSDFHKGNSSVGPSAPEPFLRLPSPKMEEGPIGRAAIAAEESAAQLQEVSGLAGW